MPSLLLRPNVNTLRKAIILNLSDGITTPMSFLLPMVLFHGHLDTKSMVLGTIGAAVSMAFAFKSAEATEGTWSEWLVSFACSALGGIIPTLCFVVFSRPLALTSAIIFVVLGIVIISHQKDSLGFWYSLYDTTKNIVPALLTVAVLSVL